MTAELGTSDTICEIVRGEFVSPLELRVLAESPNYRLCHSYEAVFVVDKRDGSVHPAGDHYGDPAVGIITPDERWFCTGGEGVLCFSLDGTLLSFFRDGPPPDVSPAVSTAWFVRELVCEGSDNLVVSFDAEEHGTWTIDLATATPTRRGSSAA
ncbi:hypothetical protein [Caldimonas brevitalea]|uniref:hypothetical protein n=1 Tax=Caldimonas brevitalea TaxID=413882 RepID=UPI0012F79F29|nr:hypothetical protein [Caldimonas brevitalea]